MKGAELVRFPTYPIGVGFNEWDIPHGMNGIAWEASRFSNAEIEDREIRGMFFRRLNTDFAHTCFVSVGETHIHQTILERGSNS